MIVNGTMRFNGKWWTVDYGASFGAEAPGTAISGYCLFPAGVSSQVKANNGELIPLLAAVGGGR